MNENTSYSDISVGMPFAFADNNADVYYFPIVCDGHIRYLFRVYPDGDSFSAAITDFLAGDIDSLANQTSVNEPMYLNLVDTKIVASIGQNSYELYEYPPDMTGGTEEIETFALHDYSIVDAKESSGINLTLKQTRDVYEYIPLEITEQQHGNSWCVAFCLATIIRTRTSYSPTARTCMTAVLGNNPPTTEVFPWGKIAYVANQYGLTPIVKSSMVSNETLIREINMKRPCIVAMDCGSNQHAVVLRGYSTVGTWGIWNPWFNFYENYSMDGVYVPTGYSAATWSYRPCMHAYYFG